MLNSTARRKKLRHGFRGCLEENLLIKPEEIADKETEIETEIAAAVAFAVAGDLEPISEIERFVAMMEFPS